MKSPRIALPRLRRLQYGFVLYAVAFAFSSPSLRAEDDESSEPSPAAVLTQTVQADTARICRRYPARIRAVEQVDVVSRLSADIVEEPSFLTGYNKRRHVERNERNAVLFRIVASVNEIWR